jgi:hypothetical protein
MRRFPGGDFIMGSIAANRILPDGPGREPHIDHPYWDFHMPGTIPAGINRAFRSTRRDAGTRPDTDYRRDARPHCPTGGTSPPVAIHSTSASSSLVDTAAWPVRLSK